MIFLVFVLCLYINYRLSIPTYEGFDSVTNVLGGILSSLFLLCALLLLFSIVRNAST